MVEEKKESSRVEFDGASVNVSGPEGEQVEIGPGGIHVRDKESDVRINWTGIRVRDRGTSLNINFWKPLVGCGLGLVILVALLTLVIVTIVRLMIN